MRGGMLVATSLVALAAVPYRAQAAQGDAATPVGQTAQATPSAPGAPPSPSLADTSSPAAADVEDIVVTARLRSETLQNTPMSVGVATAQAIENAHVTSALDLQNVVPGFIVERAPAALNTAVALRGLGASTGSATTESSIAFFVNGVYLPRSRDFSTALFDADHVEVVRGTQGALLGKNTSLGAVNLVTRTPGHTLEGNISASHEFELHSWTVTGGVSVPLSATLAVRLAGLYDDDGGFVRNAVTGRHSGGATRATGRATAVWTPSPTFDATLLYEHQHVQLRGATPEIVQPNAGVLSLAATGGQPTFVYGLDRVNYDSDSHIPDGFVDTLNINRASLTAHLHLGDHVVTSQTGWSDGRGNIDAGPDYLPGDYFRIITPVDNGSSLSQELRLTSPSAKPFRYVVGGWYGSNTVNQVSEWILNYPTALGSADFTNYVHQKSRSWSAFTQLDYDIFSRLTLSGGARYTEERKTADLARIAKAAGVINLFFPTHVPFTQSRKETALDGLVNLSYRPAGGVMIYAAWAQGTKSGGYADSVGILDQSEFRPEVARTAELGVRFQTDNRALTVNATLFSTKVKDYQLVLFNGATFVVSNTQLKSAGIESQIIWRPAFVPGLKIDWSNTYAEAKDRVTDARIPNAPRWSGGVMLDYEHAVGGGFKLRLDGGANYESSEVRSDNSSVPVADGVTKYDASIGVESDRGYAIRLFGRNITNANRAVFEFPTPFVGAGTYTAVSERPRTITLELSYKF